MVGQALHHASDLFNIPCHRVVNFQGRLAPGWTEQKQLLTNEGIRFKENGCVDLKKYLWDVSSGSISRLTLPADESGGFLGD